MSWSDGGGPAQDAVPDDCVRSTSVAELERVCPAADRGTSDVACGDNGSACVCCAAWPLYGGSDVVVDGVWREAEYSGY